LSLTYPHKKKSRKWYPAIVVARVSDHPKTDEHLNPSVDVHNLVGKLSTAETVLRCKVKFQHVQVNICWINICNQGKNLCSPCTYTNCKHSWDPNTYPAFIDLIRKKAWWWPCEGRNM
jgi:hypothetical protein